MHVNYIRNFLHETRDRLNNECHRLHSHNNQLLGHLPAEPSPGSPDAKVASEPTCFDQEYQLLVGEIGEKLGWLAMETDRATSITNEKEQPSSALTR